MSIVRVYYFTGYTPAVIVKHTKIRVAFEEIVQQLLRTSHDETHAQLVQVKGEEIEVLSDVRLSHALGFEIPNGHSRLPGDLL